MWHRLWRRKVIMLLKTSSLEAEPEAGISAPTICCGDGVLLEEADVQLRLRHGRVRTQLDWVSA